MVERQSRLSSWLRRRLGVSRGGQVTSATTPIEQPASVERTDVTSPIPATTVPVDQIIAGESVVPVQPPDVVEEVGIVVPGILPDVTPAVTEAAIQKEVEEIAVGSNTEIMANRDEVFLPDDLKRMLLSSDSQALNTALNTVRDTLPLREAAAATAHFTRENQSVTGAYALGDGLDNIASILALRRESATGQSLTLTSEETQSISDLFAAVRERLPLMREQRQQRPEQLTASSVHSLLNRNPELAGAAQELVKKIGRPPVETLVHRVAAYAPTVSMAQISAIIDAGERRTAEVVTGIDRFNFLSGVLRGLPTEQRQQIIEGLSRYIQLDQGAERQRLLQAIFTSPSSDRLGTALRNSGVNLDQLPQLLGDEAIMSLVAVMLDRPDQYRFQLGTILSQIPLTNIPEALRDRLAPIITDSELKIKTEHGSWWLCGQAEPRLERSISNQAVVLVNGQLLAKFDGKFSALCLNTFSTREGQTFLAGNWYSPTDNRSREIIRSTFDGGSARVDLQGGEWTIMRPLTEYRGRAPDEILQEARQFASALPDRLPDRMEGMERRRYREIRREAG